MNKGVLLALSSAAIFAFTAETPAIAPATASSPSPALVQSLRHLEYHFAVTYTTTGEGHDSGIGTTGSGVISYQGSAGRQGSVVIDVVGVAKDGGLVIRAQENAEGRVGQRPPVTCAVYGDSRVLCADTVNAPTDAMAVLLSHLGRNFYDPSIVDDKGHWERRLDDKTMKVVTSFSMPAHADGKPATIYEHRDIKSLDGTQDDMTEDSRISYDIDLSVPDSITNEAAEASRGEGYMRTKIDLTLMKDSFAKP